MAIAELQVGGDDSDGVADGDDRWREPRERPERQCRELRVSGLQAARLHGAARTLRRAIPVATSALHMRR